MIEQPQFSIVLYQPTIPPNTGTIGRLCVATNCDLHIIKPMGFVINDRTLRRAGLDYWEFLDVYYHESYQDFLEKHPNRRMFYVTKFGKQLYTKFEYKKGDIFIFGSETKGLPKDILSENADKTIQIPMFSENIRSLNLALSVGIVLYEAIRQVKN